MSVTESDHPVLSDVPTTELIEEPSTTSEIIQRAPVDPTDLSLRLEMLENSLSPLAQQGHGYLWLPDKPAEDNSTATPKLVWESNSTLTCQTSKGRNLQLRGLRLLLWRDARYTFSGPLFNVSRHSNWDVYFSVEAWFKSGHETRPRASQLLGSTSIPHGKSFPVEFRGYSDSLARLYGAYSAGELALRFRISATRNN